MKSKPLPCWRCGGKASCFGGAGNHAVKCNVCGVTNERLVADETTYLGYEGYSTEDEAVKSWNQRYEHTCHSDKHSCCSECGAYLNSSYEHVTAIDQEIAELEEWIHAAEERIVKQALFLNRSLTKHLGLSSDANFLASETKMRHESIQSDITLINLCNEKLELLNKIKSNPTYRKDSI